jgi:CIC family chloride channel protein
MACFGSVAHAPLAVMIMVAEMTGSFSVVPGAIVCVGIAYLLISRTNVSMYKSQRFDRETAAAERAGVIPLAEPDGSIDPAAPGQ